MPGLADIAKPLSASLLALLTARYLWGRFRCSESPSAEQTKAISLKNQTKKKDEPANEDDVVVYFGSQSGTAQGFAEELAEEAKQYGLNCRAVDMEDFDEEEYASHKCIVLLLATYGEGDPTDNAIDFFKWIQDASLEGDTFNGVKFTVFGLGNRQYVNFNSCGRIADKEMERLGASRIYDRGEGDDDQNIEEDFEQWKENGLWPALQQAVGREVSGEKTEAAGLETAEEVLGKLQLKAVIGDLKTAPYDPLVQVGGSDIAGKWYFHASLAPITSCYELRQKPDAGKGDTTLHVDFNVKSFPSLDWRTADNLEILAPNPDEHVEWFAERLNVKQDLDKNLTFVRAQGVDKAVKRPFPAPCTVRGALSLFCELGRAPSKVVAKRFASLLKDDQERDTLEKLLKDRETWHWLTGDHGGEKSFARLNLREFFELFLPSADIDFSAFVQLCSRQRNRAYTIASSSRADAHTIGVCVSMEQESLANMASVLDELKKRGHSAPGAAAVLQHSAQQARFLKGLCSTALCRRMENGDKLWIHARSSTFRLPRRSATPIIMVSAGTGMAPFRGFVQEFKAEGGVRTKTIMFFGCRRSDEDFIYKDELQEALDNKWLGELVTAFSREQAHKIYVQDRLKERSDEIGKLLLEEGAYLFMCGSTAMGAAVNDVLTPAVKGKANMDQLRKEGKIVEELW